MSNIQVRLVKNPTDEDIEKAVSIYARAFEDEDFLRLGTGDNANLNVPFFRCRISQLKGRLYFAVDTSQEGEEKILGAAFWTVNDTSIRLPEIVQQNMNAFEQLVDPEVRKWWNTQYVPPIVKLLDQYSGRVWYLKYLGVLPECRRRGIGRVLVKALKDQAKTEGWNFLLCTQGLDHVKLYESLGYRVADTCIITGGALGDFPMYIMVDGFDRL